MFITPAADQRTFQRQRAKCRVFVGPNASLQAHTQQYRTQKGQAQRASLGQKNPRKLKHSDLDTYRHGLDKGPAALEPAPRTRRVSSTVDLLSIAERKSMLIGVGRPSSSDTCVRANQSA